MRYVVLRSLRALVAAGALMSFIAFGALAVAGAAPVGDDTPSYTAGTQPLRLDEEGEEQLLALDNAFVSGRTAGSHPIDIGQAGELRGKAAEAAKKLRKEHI